MTDVLCELIVLYKVVLFQLPAIAKGIGKRVFKAHVESFLDAIFYSVVSKTSSCQVYVACYSAPDQLKLLFMYAFDLLMPVT